VCDKVWNKQNSINFKNISNPNWVKALKQISCSKTINIEMLLKWKFWFIFYYQKVWFQNRRAKFRKQERLNQQKASGQSSNSSNSSNSQNGNNSSNGSTNNGNAGGNNQSSSNLENAGNANQNSQKADSNNSAVAQQQLHQQNTTSAKDIKSNSEKTINGMIIFFYANYPSNFHNFFFFQLFCTSNIFFCLFCSLL
jgi:hypothetical protein